MTSTCIHIPIPQAPAVPAEPVQPDARLGAALPLLRGGVMADVGTDHAYLPIAALRQGLCDFAVATDIHRGPAEVAAAHLAANGLSEKEARVLLTDGLHGAWDYHPTDICIFGMGGEMIARIIDEAPWVKDRSVRLILQPMTKQETLREYLAQNGFQTIREQLVKTDRIYTVLCAEYNGQVRTLTPLERLMGRDNLERGDALTQELAHRHVDVLSATREGKLKGVDPDTAREDELLAALHQYLKSITEE